MGSCNFWQGIMLYSTLAVTVAVFRGGLNTVGVVAEKDSDDFTHNGLLVEGGRRHRLLTHRQNLFREEMTVNDEEQRRHLKKEGFGSEPDEISLVKSMKKEKKDLLSRPKPNHDDLTKQEKKGKDNMIDNGGAGDEIVEMSKKDRKTISSHDKSNNKEIDGPGARLTKKEKKEIIKKKKSRNKDSDLTKKEKKEARNKSDHHDDSDLIKKEKKERTKQGNYSNGNGKKSYGAPEDKKSIAKKEKDIEKKKVDGKESVSASSFASGGGGNQYIEKDDDEECICEEVTWWSGGSRGLEEVDEENGDEWSMADAFESNVAYEHDDDNIYIYDEDNNDGLDDDIVYHVDGEIDLGRVDTMDKLALSHAHKTNMQTFAHGFLEYTSWGGSSSKSGKNTSHRSKSGKGGKSTKRAKNPKRGKGKKQSGKSKKLKPPVHCTCKPTRRPTSRPTPRPTPKKAPPVPESPTFSPTLSPSLSPTLTPTLSPTFSPTLSPAMRPTLSPTLSPTFSPTLHPTVSPTLHPTVTPTFSPTWSPTLNPTLSPTPIPTVPPGTPSRPPTTPPTPGPTPQPSLPPSTKPTDGPTPVPDTPTSPPTTFPTHGPTEDPTSAPTASPTKKPTPSPLPTQPTSEPTNGPTPLPGSPTRAPTKRPTLEPGAPTMAPTQFPTAPPTHSPTRNLTPQPGSPTRSPTRNPTPQPGSPTRSPTRNPTPQPGSPTNSPTRNPTSQPTKTPTKSPTRPPSEFPTRSPTRSPTPAPGSPTRAPTRTPTRNPTRRPSNEPTISPTESPSARPTFEQDVIDLGACRESNFAPMYLETLEVANANDNSLFGTSVSMDESWAVVGSPGADNQFGEATGTAYLYRFSNGSWRQRQVFSPSSGLWEFSEFGRSVGLSGNTLVIGAPEVNGGAVFVYTRQREFDAFDSGIELSTPSSLSDDARFGYSVSIDGNLLVVGAPNDSNGRGSSFIYNYNDVTETWDLERRLESNSSQNQEGGNFGRSVSIDSELIVVGAPFEEVDNIRSGTASVYRRGVNNGIISWSLIQQLLPESNSRSNGDEFGWDTEINVVSNTATVSVSARGMLERSGAVYIFISDSNTFNLQQKLVASDPQANANFGESVSLHGDDVVVGSPIYNNGIGAAYYYRRIGTSWTLGGKQFFPIRHDDDSDLYGFSVAISDDKIFVGSPAADAFAFNAGLVDAFLIGCVPSCPPGADPGFGLRPLNTDNINSSDQVELEMFGYSVSVFGSYAIVGAPGGENDGGIATGVAYVLAFINGSWSEHHKLIPFDISAEDLFGYAVSISSDVIVVGSPNQHNGAAYIFRKNFNNIFQLEEKLMESSSTSNAYFGAAVDVDGNYVIVGSRKNRNGRGSASIYLYDEGKWKFDILLQPDSSDGDAYDGNYGWSVSISEDMAAVGAPNDLTAGSIRSGQVYVYERSLSFWNFIQIIGDSDTVESRDPGDSFGADVDINKSPSFSVETTLVVGASGKDIDINGINFPNAGAAYIFVRANSGMFSHQQTLVATNPLQDEAFGSSVAVDLDSVVVGKLFGDAYYYHRKRDGKFEEGQRFTSSLDVNVNDVAIHRDAIFAGAPDTTVNNVESGTVLIFAIECDELCAPSDLSAVMNQDILPPNLSSDDRFGSSIAFDTNTNIAVIGAAYARNSDGTASGVAYLFGFVDFQWQIISELKLSDGNSGDLFGYSVAITGSTIVVGSPGRQSGKGTAHVFKPNSSGDFSQTQTIQPSDIANNAFFGSAADADGNLIAIGARLDRNGRGSAFIYSRDTSIVDYELERILSPSNVATDVNEGNFGWSVAIHLESLVIGAPNDIISTLQSGSAFIYRRSEEITGDFVWNEVEKIEHPIAERANGNKFGFSVDIFVDCETVTTSVLIGAPFLDGEPSTLLADAGAAYLFSEFVTGSFTLVTKLLPEEQTEGAQFGSSVTLDGGVAVVGSPFYNSNVGAAYLFGRSVNGWAAGSMIVARPTSNDLFGSYVVLEGSQAMISAPANSENGVASGKVYSYEVGCAPVCARLKSTPVFIQAFLPSDAISNDEFGYSVQVYGSYAVMGSPGFGNSGDDRGRVFIFRFINGVWVLVDTILGQTDGDRFGYSVSISGSIVVVGSPVASNSKGAVSILEVSGNSVLERGILVGESDGDFFGASVDVSEATIVVGAPLSRNGAGSVYIYSEVSANTWDLEQSIAPSDSTEDDNGGNFGFSVAIFFDTIIIGAKSQDVATGQSGASYIYERVSWGDWDRIENVFSTDGSPGDQFGYSVDIYIDFVTEMTYAIVGARRASGSSGVSLSGQVYIYSSFRSGSFTLQQILLATKLDESRGFGTSVSIDGQHVVVGAAVENSIGSSYFYQLIEDETWRGNEIFNPSSNDSNEGFGFSVSLYQDHIFIGSPQKDSDRGSAYYYDIQLICDDNPPSPTPIPTNAPTPQPTIHPTRAPTQNPTREPNDFPTRNPTKNPTKTPTSNPTKNPTRSPSRSPTRTPTNDPTRNPNRMPTESPTREPTRNPTKKPTLSPTKAPTRSPTRTPTKSPNSPTESPTEEPTTNPSGFPTARPSRDPTSKPTLKPTNKPTERQSHSPSQYPSDSPTKPPSNPTKAPTTMPTRKPTPAPTRKPTKSPTTSPTTSPTINPTIGLPTLSPTQCDIFVPKTEYRRRVEAVDRDTDFEFGYSVAIWNVTTVVGSPGSISVPTLFPGAGYSYDFKFDNQLQRYSWKYSGKLAPQPGIGDGIGISVSVAGNYAILGGPFDDQLGANSGSVHLFQRTTGGDAFTFAQTVYSPTPAASALFGWSVAVNENGDVAIGARGDRVARGSVYIYRKSPDSPLWTFVDTLEPDVTQDLQNVGNFGWSVAFGENILAVGAPNEGVGAEKHGAVLVYERSAGNTWTLAETVVPMDGRQGDLFGFSVAIDEPTIVVGSRNATHNGLADAGAVYVYAYSSSGVDLDQKLIADNRAARALFGQSVAISDGRLVVGAPYPSNVGSVYLYYQDDGAWTLSERIVAEDTGIGTNVGIEFGASVAVTLDHLIVGSPANDVAATNSGSVFFYDIVEVEQCRK